MPLMAWAWRDELERGNRACAVEAVAHPPRWYRLMGGAGLDAEPGGAGGDGVARLLGAVEELFDATVVARAAPCFEQAADGVDAEHVLERQSDLRSHHRRQWKGEDGVLHDSHTSYAYVDERDRRQVTKTDCP